MLIEFHRHNADGLNPDEGNRVAIEARDIVSIHEGKGGWTVITTPNGKLPVEESYDEAIKLRNGGCRDF